MAPELPGPAPGPEDAVRLGARRRGDQVRRHDHRHRRRRQGDGRRAAPRPAGARAADVGRRDRDPQEHPSVAGSRRRHRRRVHRLRARLFDSSHGPRRGPDRALARVAGRRRRRRHRQEDHRGARRARRAPRHRCRHQALGASARRHRHSSVATARSSSPRASCWPSAPRRPSTGCAAPASSSRTACCATSTNHVVGAENMVACGDVARWPNMRFNGVVRRVEHWLNAVEGGRAAAENLLVGRSHAKTYTPVPRFWTEQYGMRVQGAGLPVLGTDTTDVNGLTGFIANGKLVGIVGPGVARQDHHRDSGTVPAEPGGRRTVRRVDPAGGRTRCRCRRREALPTTRSRFPNRSPPAHHRFPRPSRRRCPRHCSGGGIRGRGRRWCESGGGRARP